MNPSGKPTTQTSYRVSVDASIEFDVVLPSGATPADVERAAAATLSEWVDADNGNNLDGLKWGRVYVSADDDHDGALVHFNIDDAHPVGGRGAGASA